MFSVVSLVFFFYKERSGFFFLIICHEIVKLEIKKTPWRVCSYHSRLFFHTSNRQIWTTGSWMKVDSVSRWGWCSASGLGIQDMSTIIWLHSMMCGFDKADIWWLTSSEAFLQFVLTLPKFVGSRKGGEAAGRWFSLDSKGFKEIRPG